MKKFMWPTRFRHLTEIIDTVPAELMEAENNGTACPSLQFRTAAGKIRINSSRNPEEEAARQIDQWLTDHRDAPSSLIVIIGCSGVAHLHHMATRLKPCGRIFVLEPHPEIFVNLLRTCDLTPLLQFSPAIFHFCAEPDPKTALDDLKDELRRCRSGKSTVFTLPGVERLFRDDFRYFREQIDILQTIEDQNRNTETIYARAWLSNAIQNLPQIISAPEIGVLHHKFAGTAAIVAAAGPGLNAMLPWIKSVAAKYPIIAVGTSLRSLIAAGIEPDFVLAVDSSIEIIPQFKSCSSRRTLLVGTHTLIPKVFDYFPDRTLLFTADLLPGFNYWLEKIGILPERLRIGGTVTLSAIDFAIHLGCSQLILAGLDLAFAENGATHAGGTIYEQARITSGTWMPVPGNHGKTVQTSRQFLSYIRMIESYLLDQHRRNPGLKVYNANPGGAAIAGTEAIMPQKLLEFDFTTVKNEKHEYIFNLVNVAKNKDAAPQLCRHIGVVEQELRQIAEQTAVAVAALNDYELQTTPQPLPELFALLNAVDARLKECSSSALLLEGIIRILYAGMTGISDDISTLLKQNKEIYRCLHEQAVITAEELGQVAARMQRQQGEK